MLVWNPAGILALLAATSLFLVAGYVLYARPAAAANQRLALLMGLEGFVIFTFGGGTFFLRDANAAWALAAAGHVAVAFKLWAYLMFLATLPVTQVRLLRRPWMSGLLFGGVVAVGLSWFALPGFFAANPQPQPGGGWFVPLGTGAFISLATWAVIWLSALVFSILAFRHARTQNGRRLAKGYLVGFGLRDVSFLLAVTVFIAAPATAPIVMGMAIPLAYTVYPWFVGYAILRHQLFDIDVRLRIAFGRSTLVALLVAAFFVMEELLADRLGDALGIRSGVLAAVAAALLAWPLRAGITKVLDQMVPGKDADARRIEVYRAAVEDALLDGTVQGAEMRLLERLRQQLGLSESSARSITHDVRLAMA